MTAPETEPAGRPATQADSAAIQAGGSAVLPAARPAAAALASRWRRAAGRLLHPGWSWTVGRDWLIPSCVAVVTLFLGAAVGGLPALLAGSWDDPQTRIATWASLALAVAGLFALTGTGLIWRGRNGVLRRHGTAYVIQETARGWTPNDQQIFLTEVKRHFARRIDVPGPGKLSGSWDWPLDEAARAWDGKVTELVRAFQALRSNDDPATPKGIFMWAWAPVAIAFGMRATAADRAMVLDVWQRPSKARAGDVEIPAWSQGSHRFSSPPLTSVMPGTGPSEHRWPAEVAITPVVAAAGSPETAASEASGPVILLIRFGRQSWGPLPEVPGVPDGPRTAPGPVRLVLGDAGGLGVTGTWRTEIQEFRIVPPAGGRQFAWASYPALAAAATDWIGQRTAGAPGRVILIGTIVPPEIALGLGIGAGQPAGPAWPVHLWPVVPKPPANELVIPRLDLGTAALAGLVPS
jgi:hypothetical protein